jgi:5'-methylthioadenosine phosphorylase
MAPAAASSSASVPVLGVLGGSGLYDLPGLTDVREETLETPFGPPSGPVVRGRLGSTEVAFLARHGRGHRFSPSEVNYRANIHALKQLGVGRLLSISAVGSLREGIVPGDLVLVDQFIDKTHGRASTFFGGGVVGHVSFADPVCSAWVDVVAQSAVAAGAQPVDRAAAAGAGAAAERPGGPGGPRLHPAGTYVCMEGPQFSTRAESHLHRSWGAHVIGMTAATEAKLAREAEMCFALLALSTDFDCWRTDEDAVTAESIMEVLKANVARAQAIVVGVAARADTARACTCARAAEHAIFTAREGISPEARERLRTLYGRYL